MWRRVRWHAERPAPVQHVPRGALLMTTYTLLDLVLLIWVAPNALLILMGHGLYRQRARRVGAE
jgi:hypothetical protein